MHRSLAFSSLSSIFCPLDQCPAHQCDHPSPGEKNKPRVIITFSSVAKNFLFSPVSSSEDFKLKSKVSKVEPWEAHMVSVPKSGGLRLCLVTRWLLQAAHSLTHSLGHSSSCLAWREGCSDGQDWADTPEYHCDRTYTPMRYHLEACPLDFYSHESSRDESSKKFD